MPHYRYRAVNPHGRIVSGMVAAMDDRALGRHLADHGMELIECRVPRESTRRVSWRKPPDRALIMLCHHAATMLQAGVPVLTMLRDLHDTVATPSLRDALGEICRDVAAGSTLSEAFARQSVFPRVFKALLAAGEKTGALDLAFRQLHQHCNWAAEIKQHLQKALRYPLFLAILTILVTGFMFGAVVPQVVEFVEAQQSVLPFFTQALLASATILTHGWWVALLLITGLVVTILIARRLSEAAILTTDRLLLRLPVIGALVLKFEMARFAHHFAVMTESGLGVLDALRGAAGVIGNRAIKLSLDEIVARLTTGVTLPDSFRKSALCPSLVVQLLHVGTQSGQLPDCLRQISSFYDDDVRRTTEKMIAGLEPALTLLIGVMLVWIVLAVLGPVYGSLAQNGMM